jgi:hypothetical protein
MPRMWRSIRSTWWSQRCSGEVRKGTLLEGYAPVIA